MVNFQVVIFARYFFDEEVKGPFCMSRYPPTWPMIKPWVVDGPFLRLNDFDFDFDKCAGVDQIHRLTYRYTLILQAKGPKVSAWRPHDAKNLLMNQPTYTYER